MLKAEPTKFGAGMTLWGDSEHLVRIHECIHQVADESMIDESDRQLFTLGLAYDIRKAFEGNRESRKDGGKQLFGVRVLWPFYLTQVILLRTASSQVHLQISELEAAAKVALCAHDADIGRAVYDWFITFPGFPDDYELSFVNLAALSYIRTRGVRYQKRFDRLLECMNDLSPDSTIYRIYLEELSAKRLSPSMVENLEWPDFRW